ncbi:hypothetical protein RND81_12G093400 [Saponaria officinalis]|uniref:Uncharacterized protein n=1 Tax=Saponaria officinalis TaxID=3572 RepID=A0AAW1H8G7_SAPOF
MTKSVCPWKVVRILLTPLTLLRRLTPPALSMTRCLTWPPLVPILVLSPKTINVF